MKLKKKIQHQPTFTIVDLLTYFVRIWKADTTAECEICHTIETSKHSIDE